MAERFAQIALPRPHGSLQVLAAGLANQYVKAGDARVLAHTKVVGPGQSDTVSVDVAKLKAGESYTFFCSFPGHAAVMKGAFKLGA